MFPNVTQYWLWENSLPLQFFVIKKLQTSSFGWLQVSIKAILKVKQFLWS